MQGIALSFLLTQIKVDESIKKLPSDLGSLLKLICVLDQTRARRRDFEMIIEVIVRSISI